VCAGEVLWDGDGDGDGDGVATYFTCRERYYSGDVYQTTARSGAERWDEERTKQTKTYSAIPGLVGSRVDE